MDKTTVRVMAIDTETTGLSNDAFVYQIGFVVADMEVDKDRLMIVESMKVVREEQFSFPTDGLEFEPIAKEIFMRNEEAQDKSKLSNPLAAFSILLSEANKADVLVSQNVSFDSRVLAYNAALHGIFDPIQAKSMLWMDTKTMYATEALYISGLKGQLDRLGYKPDESKLHTALYDAHGCMYVFCRLVKGSMLAAIYNKVSK